MVNMRPRSLSVIIRPASCFCRLETRSWLYMEEHVTLRASDVVKASG